MRRQLQEQQKDGSYISQQEDVLLMKLNQTLLPQSYFILFLIIVVSLLANTTRGYDYNVVVGCGIYFLSTKNPVLHKMFYFYLLLGMTICADGIVIALLFGKVSVFHSLIAPVIEILLKIILLVLEGLQWIKESKEQQQKNMKQIAKDFQIRKQIEERKSYELNKLRFTEGKKDKQFNPSNYYMPKQSYNQPFQQNFKSQVYKEFDQQQFIDGHSGQY